MINFDLHDGQYKVATDSHKYKIICAGRQWGKSVLSRNIILKWASSNPGRYWIVSPTYRQGKQIHWLALQQEVPKDWVTKKNEVELSITLVNGSIIEIKGADNPDSLRGVKLNGLVVDEIATIRNWNWLWNEVLQATLLVNNSPAIFISTPKGFNHFYDLYNQGQKEGEYKSWRFTSYDNPYIPKESIDEKKNYLAEDTFQQEYMADFRNAVGLAHKNWDREIHVIEPFEIPSEWSYARGFDYGSTHPTGSVRVAIDHDDNWFVDSCYKQANRTVSEHSQAILAQDYGKGMIPCYGDPSGAQWFTEFTQYNLHIRPANKEVGQAARGWVEHCVEKVNELLKPIPGKSVFLPDGRHLHNTPKLFVFKNSQTEELIKELERLKWKETSTGVTIPVLDENDDPDGHYDLAAALRYLAVSYSRPNFNEYKRIRMSEIQYDEITGAPIFEANEYE